MFDWNGRTFDFRIPDPFDGCAIWNYMTSYNFPFGAGPLFGFAPKQVMTAAQLREFQALCLRNCFELLGDPDKPHKAYVVNSEGFTGINNASAPLLTALTVQYITFFTQWWREESPSVSDPAGQDTPQ